MTRIHQRLLANPHLARTLSFLAVLIAVGFAVLTVVLYYDGKAGSSSNELHRLQAAFCGTPGDPGLLPVIASAPLTSKTTELGRKLVSGSERAAAVIQCTRRLP
jgi:hypothetical protein